MHEKIHDEGVDPDIAVGVVTENLARPIDHQSFLRSCPLSPEEPLEAEANAVPVTHPGCPFHLHCRPAVTLAERPGEARPWLAALTAPELRVPRRVALLLLLLPPCRRLRCAAVGFHRLRVGCGGRGGRLSLLLLPLVLLLSLRLLLLPLLRFPLLWLLLRLLLLPLLRLLLVSCRGKAHAVQCYLHPSFAHEALRVTDVRPLSGAERAGVPWLPSRV